MGVFRRAGRDGASRSRAASAPAPSPAQNAASSDSVRRGPDVFVGIDSPAFNLGLAKRLSSAGSRLFSTSVPRCGPGARGASAPSAKPAIWCCACCRSRPTSMHSTACARCSSAIRWRIRFHWKWIAQARGALWESALDATVVALLPGSRMGEVERLGADFAAAAAWIASAARRAIRCADGVGARASAFERTSRKSLTRPDHLARWPSATGTCRGRWCHRRFRDCDARDTALGRPMVVAYRFSAMTAFLLRTLGLVKVPYFSQPNLLVGRRLVPEFLQEQVSGSALGAALLQGSKIRSPASSARVPTCTKFCVAVAPSARRPRSSISCGVTRMKMVYKRRVRRHPRRRC